MFVYKQTVCDYVFAIFFLFLFSLSLLFLFFLLSSFSLLLSSFVFPMFPPFLLFLFSFEQEPPRELGAVCGGAPERGVRSQCFRRPISQGVRREGERGRRFLHKMRLTYFRFFVFWEVILGSHAVCLLLFVRTSAKSDQIRSDPHYSSSCSRSARQGR